MTREQAMRLYLSDIRRISDRRDKHLHKQEKYEHTEIHRREHCYVLYLVSVFGLAVELEGYKACQRCDESSQAAEVHTQQELCLLSGKAPQKR